MTAAVAADKLGLGRQDETAIVTALAAILGLSVAMLVSGGITRPVQRLLEGTRAVEAGIPMLAHASALAYFDSYRTARLPQSLTQAQRDAFGAHTYERTDRPGAVHSEW